MAPNDLFDFAFIKDMDVRLDELSVLAETEDWTYQNAHSKQSKPILFKERLKNLPLFA